MGRVLRAALVAVSSFLIQAQVEGKRRVFQIGAKHMRHAKCQLFARWDSWLGPEGSGRDAVLAIACY